MENTVNQPKENEMRKNWKESKKTTKQHFDQIAGNYDDSHDGKFVRCMYQEIVDRVLACEGTKLLDLGCGNGNVLASLVSYPEKELYGMDLSEKMIEEARQRLPEGVNLCVGDAERLPYADQSFDIIICNASFHHYPKPDVVLEEIRRVLKKGGIFILGDPTVPFAWYQKIVNFTLRFMDTGDYHIYAKKEITRLLTEHGFDISQWKNINARTFILNAKSV